MDRTAAEAAVSIIDAELALSPSLSSWAWLGRKGIEGASGGLPRETAARYGLAGCKSLIVAALNYGEGPLKPPEWAQSYPGPLLKLARFARADWYGELCARLKAAAARARARLAAESFDPGSPDEWRCLANSGLPEKAFALASGLGWRGRNDLVIVTGGHGFAQAFVGPGAVLGLLLLPFDIDSLGPLPGSGPVSAQALLRGGSCGSCHACVDACPSHALGPEGFTRELCRQHWSARAGELPPAVAAAWGDMLYGCDLCLEACPHFHTDADASCGRGLLGPGLPLAWLLEAGEAEMRGRLRGTVLGRKWMDYDAFRRSARLASGSIII